MKTIDSVFGNSSQKVGQLPPKIKNLYHKSRAGFPLGFGHASSYVGRGVALIGCVINIIISFYSNSHTNARIVSSMRIIEIPRLASNRTLSGELHSID